MEDELEFKPYTFSEEFTNEFPEFVDGWYERKRQQEITNRNVEELQMRLNIQIERDKQRLWSDDKLDPITLIDPYYMPESKLFSTQKIIYNLFWNSPKCMVFDPSAIYFK